MKHSDALKKQVFDTRLINWNLKRGEITQAQLQEHVQNLVDVSDNAKAIEIEVEEVTEAANTEVVLTDELTLN